MAPALHISIPTTSIATPSDAKPYTLYHIHLQLPLRLHEVHKRYTDFTHLQQALISETNAEPPAPLPAKSWIRRTVNNDALTEDRRKSLETYVRKIIDAEDARWRSSVAWRTFLNLPGAAGAVGNSAATSGKGAAAGDRKRRPSSAGGIHDPQEWLEVHQSLKSYIHAARGQLKQRDAATTAQQQHGMSAEAKASLVRAATAIAQLEDGLRNMSNASKGDEAGWGGSKKLGAGEIRRRRDLVGAAKSEVEGLEGVLRSMATRSSGMTGAPASGTAAATTGDKEALWKGTSAATKTSGRVLGGPLKETEQTRELDNAGVLQLQKQVMQEQDEDVLLLGKTVSRLKDMGILINEELEVQSDMLGLLEHDVDRVQGKIDVGRQRIGKIK